MYLLFKFLNLVLHVRLCTFWLLCDLQQLSKGKSTYPTCNSSHNDSQKVHMYMEMNLAHTYYTYVVLRVWCNQNWTLPSCAISHSQKSWLLVPGPALLTLPGETHLKPPEYLVAGGSMYLDHLITWLTCHGQCKVLQHAVTSASELDVPYSWKCWR